MRKSAKSRNTHCFLKMYQGTFNRYVTLLEGKGAVGFVTNRHRIMEGVGVISYSVI